MKKISLISFCLIVLSSITFANNIKVDDPRSWNIDDVLKQEYASSFDISPDGNWVIWIKRSPNEKKNKLVGHIYKTSLKDSTEIQLTRGKNSSKNPKWSPDGKLIAFLAKRGEDKKSKTQIWLMNSRGGEPYQLTSKEKGVKSFEWLNEKEIIFSAREDEYLLEKEKEEKKDDAIVVGDQEHYRPVRLFQISLKNKEVERISENKGKVNEFAISPNGKWIVTNENQNIHYQYDNRIPPKQYLYNLENATREEIFTKESLDPRSYKWSLDSRGFYCTYRISKEPDDDYISIPALYYFDVENGEGQSVPLNWDWKMGFFGYFVTSEGVLTSLANGPHNKLAFYQKQEKGWNKQNLEDKKQENIFIKAVSDDGKKVIYTYTTASHPAEIKTAKINNSKLIEKKEIIKINKWTDKKEIAKSEVIYWKGARGDKVNGILYYPHDYDPDKKYPLMCSIHGGPSSADLDIFSESWAEYPNILASRGSFVLKVNYHGSGNHGLEWVDAIREHYYEYEVPDIMKGIDHLIDKDMVDPDSLGIMGWSNGAILSIQSVIESDRFNVTAPGAGNVNWTSDYGNCAFGAGFDNAYFGGPPWEKTKYYIKKSPLFKMEKVTTPTIIFFGTEDRAVPTEQGWEHYRALQQIGKAPVRFLLFPGEPHGLRKLSHQRRKMEEELRWFNKYFFGLQEKENEAFKKKSPLANALKLQKAESSEGFFGEKYQGTLIPEAVKQDSIIVGRFEVTRALYAEFDDDYTFSPVKGNYPVNNITYEKAKDYCQWLSKLTGKQYRLPSKKEFDKLANLVDKSEKSNNLNYWAGYDINIDDAELLHTKIEKEKTDLIKAVGSFLPVGENDLYDLGGNVAEWCIDNKSQPKVLGASAINPVNVKTEYEKPPLKYTGFRVIMEKGDK